LLIEQGKFDDAEPLLRETLAALQKSTTGTDHRIGATRCNLGQVLSGLNRLPEAEAELLEAERILAPQRGAWPDYYASCVNSLASLYSTWNKAEPGKGYDLKAAQWKAKLRPTTTPTTSATQP
jgi:hypothetical protein